MAIDPRVRVFALYAPVSSDMSENARKWWLANGSQGPLGSPDADPQAYAHISPRNYLDRTKAPVLFLQGSEDEDIPAAWTNATVAALQQRGIATRTVWLPGAHHDLVGADLAAANAAAEAWIRASLSG
jgi:dipeptidyl aminopeptidase/acylaminoacyl peptidase